MRAVLLASVMVLAACDTTRDEALIVSYTGPEITEADARVVDGAGLERGWTADVAALGARRTVALHLQTLCGDECSRTVSLRFEGPTTGLPSSVAGVVAQQESLPERRTEEPLSIDRVEIQSWGPVYSGIAYPTPQLGASTAPLVFWTDDVAVLID